MGFSQEPWYLVEGTAREIDLWHPDDNGIQLGPGRTVISIVVEEYVEYVNMTVELDEGVTFTAFMEGFYLDPVDAVDYDTDFSLTGTATICASACARNVDNPRRLFVLQERIPVYLTYLAVPAWRMVVTHLLPNTG